MQGTIARLAIAIAVLATTSLLTLPRAESAAFPEKPIRWVVPYPPGGSNDILARFLGAKLTDRLHEQVVIDNRGGANGIIGAELASHASPDGYTILMISTSYVMNAAVRSLPYDILRSFDPVATIATSPNCIVVSPNAPFHTLSELVERAKAEPGKLNYASTGVGGFNHFGGELFKKVAGINLVHVPYRGGGPAMTDVMSGQVPIMFSSLTQVMANVRNGRLKVLAVGADHRSPAMPDVPTVAESGYPGYNVAVWWAVAVPAGVPRNAVAALRSAFGAILEEADTQKRLAGDAAQPLSMTRAEMRHMIKAELDKWTDVARTAGIRVPGQTAAR